MPNQATHNRVSRTANTIDPNRHTTTSDGTAATLIFVVYRVAIIDSHEIANTDTVTDDRTQLYMSDVLMQRMILVVHFTRTPTSTHGRAAVNYNLVTERAPMQHMHTSRYSAGYPNVAQHVMLKALRKRSRSIEQSRRL